MTEIINFNKYRVKVEERKWIASGYPKYLWDLLIEGGYDPLDSEDIKMFFKDLEEG
jgi:hypothetical protein|tara:strand:+ start:434 stop:601 length:168 start_codon:yes stop_codon:yes gene_type:complete